MIKRYLKLIIICTSTITLSCNSSFLDRYPETEITSNPALWSNEESVRKYNNKYYSRYLPEENRSMFSAGNFSKDVDTDTQPSNSYNYIFNSQFPILETDDYWNWEDIIDFNYMLINMESSTLIPEIKNRYIGETLFFKAYSYFKKLTLFGDLFYFNKVFDKNDKELLHGRDPRDYVVTKILEDLDKAIDYLPTIDTETWKGRINKETALILQAKIALFEGTWEKYHKGTAFGVVGKDGRDFLQKAVEASDKLIEMGTLSLDNVGEKDGYRNLFIQTDFSSSKEVTFWRKYSLSENYFHRWSLLTATGGAAGASKLLVDQYLCRDGKPIAISDLYQGDNTLKDVVKNRDPRLSQTIQVDDNEHIVLDDPSYKALSPKFIAPSFNSRTPCSTGYQIYKGHNPNTSEYVAAKSTTALIYFRYAECLLINAEAKAELAVITQSDIDRTINRLRKRVNMIELDLNNITPDPNWLFPHLSPVINEIRRERTVEFACEGLREEDINRWAAAKELIVGKRPLGAKRAQWDRLYDKTDNLSKLIVKEYLGDQDQFFSSYPINKEGYIDMLQKSLPNGYQFNVNKDYLRPIPLAAIRLSKDNIKQNPGW